MGPLGKGGKGANRPGLPDLIAPVCIHRCPCSVLQRVTFPFKPLPALPSPAPPTTTSLLVVRRKRWALSFQRRGKCHLTFMSFSTCFACIHCWEGLRRLSNYANLCLCPDNIVNKSALAPSVQWPMHFGTVKGGCLIMIAIMKYSDSVQKAARAPILCVVCVCGVFQGEFGKCGPGKL